MQQIGLGTEQPQVEPNEEDDERTESDEVQHHVAEPTQQSEEQVQVEDITNQQDSDTEEDEEEN
jgi:hypothetical protein